MHLCTRPAHYYTAKTSISESSPVVASHNLLAVVELISDDLIDVNQTINKILHNTDSSTNIGNQCLPDPPDFDTFRAVFWVYGMSSYSPLKIPTRVSDHFRRPL